MRLLAVAAFAFALAACGSSGDGGDLAAGNSEVSAAQVDAALGPADQSSGQDAIAAEDVQNGVVTGNETAPAANSAAANDEDE